MFPVKTGEMKEKLLTSIDSASVLVSNAELRRKESGYFTVRSSEYKLVNALIHRQEVGGEVKITQAKS